MWLWFEKAYNSEDLIQFQGEKVYEREEYREEAESGPCYEGLFIVGITLIGAGAGLMTTNIAMSGLLVLGVIFMMVSIANRDKWKRV